MTPIESSILKTLCYADIFDYPLTSQEIHRFFIHDSPLKLASIPQSKLYASNSGYYFLTGRQSIVALRQKRALISAQKLSRAQTVARKLSHLPFVLGIFITGNLSMHNANTSDDIDFLILTQAYRLWSTRLLVTLYLEILGIRRRPSRLHPGVNDFADQICANMYLDETALTLPRSKRNLYTAHEVAQVLPLINKNQIYDRFLSANSWISQYLPNIFIKPVNQSTSQPVNSSRVESLAFRLQRAYMSRRITRETITPHAAFFHPRPTSQHVLPLYRSRLAHSLSLVSLT